MRKIQYHENGALWQYIVENVQCTCKCNVFHHTFDGEKVYCTCNACNTDIAEIKAGFTEENLKKGIWK